MSYKGSRAKPRRRPTIEKRTVVPRRPKNADVRPREFLTPDEVERLIAAAKKDMRRHPHRDATMLLLAYRHGLRASELIGVRWDMLDLEQGTFHVSRRKNGRASMHIVRGDEIRALRKLKRDQVPSSPYVFTSERLGPLTVAGFQKLIRRIGDRAGFPFPVHPHMLRHGCGFALANSGKHDTRAIQEWLGHRNIQHTTR